MHNITKKSLTKGKGGSFALTLIIKTACLCFVPLLIAEIATAQSPVQKININVSNATLKEVFVAIEQQSTYRINYTKPEINDASRVSVNVKNVTIREALTAALRNTGYQFTIEGSLVFIQPQPVKQETPRSPGKISGTVIDEENGHPVSDASIRIENKGATTAIDGTFSLSLPKGTYEAEISSVGYGKKIISEIVVKDNEVFTLNVTLKREKGQLSAVVVRASARKESVASLYVRQKNNVAISDGISAEQIQRTPDNNVAQVLKRVSGLTVQEGKFVTVRGMSERYNNVLMNGASLPSTEANRRNFSFDIIPSNLIDNVVVNKTATPDLPGEFTGGMVQVNTIDVPNKNFIQLGVGSGFNSNSTGKEFISTKRFDGDYWASKGKERNWFSQSFFDQHKAAYDKYNTSGDAAALESLKKLSASIPNNYGLFPYTAKPFQIYQLSMGGRHQFKDESSLGVILAGSYRHEEFIEDYSARLRQGPTIIDSAKDYNFVTTIGAVGTVAWQKKGNKIAWRNLYNRRFNHETNHRKLADMGGQGYDVMLRQYISIVEQADLFHSRLEGEHALGKKGIKFDWFGDMATVVKEQPDNRYSQAEIGGIDPATGKEVLEFQYGGVQGNNLTHGGILASRLKETKKNIGGNFSFPFQYKQRTQKLKAGYWGTFRDADYRQSILLPKGLASSAELTEIGYGKSDYEIFTPENMANGYYYYGIGLSGQLRGDYYIGEQQIHAGYLMADLNPVQNLRLTGGLRLEDNLMKIRTGIDNTNAGAGFNEDSTVKFSEINWLPSVNAIYSITPKINVRASYSQTVARADFREKTTYGYFDFAMRTTIYGRTALKNTSIQNGDLRLEWYPGPGEVIAVSGFYKKFKDPVEMVSYRGSDGNYILFYYNLTEATNTGFEFDLRKSLSFLQPSSKFLQNLFINANYTNIKSEVSYDPKQLEAAAANLPIPERSEASERKRPLAGLSPYIINGGISYQGEVIGAQVNYNRFGRRVIFAGVDEYDDTYENPRDIVDFQLNARLFKKKLELRFNIADLLHQDYIEYFNHNTGYTPNDKGAKGMGYDKDSDWTLRRVQRGTNYTFTINYRF